MNKKPFIPYESKEMEQYRGEKVDVYFNLHTTLWSVRSRKTGRVLFHTDRITVENAEFKVSEAGRQRVLKEKRKNVHAVVRGTIRSNALIDTGHHELISYNPYRGPFFYDKKTNGNVFTGDYVILDRHGDKRNVWVSNPKGEK